MRVVKLPVYLALASAAVLLLSSVASAQWSVGGPPYIAGWLVRGSSSVRVTNGELYQCGTLYSGQTMQFKIGRPGIPMMSPWNLIPYDIDEYGDPYSDYDHKITCCWVVSKNDVTAHANGLCDILIQNGETTVSDPSLLSYEFDPYSDFCDASGDPSGEYKIRWYAWDSGMHSPDPQAVPPGEPTPIPAAMDWVMGIPGSGCFEVNVALPVDRPLPDSALNQAAGSARCNIRWANSDYQNDPNIAYGDDFTMPSGCNWVIDRIRVWAVPSVPVTYTQAGDLAYELGDLFTSVALYTGEPGSGFALRASGTLSEGSNTIAGTGATITATRVMYQNGEHYEHYETASGQWNQIWQVDFDGLNWQVGGGTQHLFCVRGAPRADCLWFNHATASQGAQVIRFDISSPSATASVDPSPWFSGKGSDINVQVFAHVAE